MRHEVESEVQGSVWKVEVAVGERVAAGDVLIILESMKMEIPVESPVAGVVSELRVTVEAAVDEEEIVAVIDSDD
ncbi:MAG: acetyl-CoA carboxylase biotin carboxyl carrier protein subunit [Gammaproteobacteria bacterium]|jgi:biotin carboxyl carrier protein|nr:acetyl-CoA carboxylase biotin carboxyl carrier protein subunit [Gammaproteobacteria bacterium]MCZ6711096.1 acetyl-CoA carboxylase biotin carboxyl carrier protein subunit [Gammaproteobacteria bacterium]